MMNKRAVILTPPIEDFYFTPARARSLGALSVQKQLDDLGMITKFFNFPLMNPHGSIIQTPEFIKHLIPYIIPEEKGPISFFTKYKRFGPQYKKSAQMVWDFKPDYIFISLFAWAYSDNALSLAEEIKKQKSGDVKIIIGGPGVSVLPEFFHKADLFDFILTGDSEVEIPKLFNSQFFPGADEKRTPAPAISFHRDKKENQWLSMIVSRGCPLLCQFCSNFLTQGRKFRSTPLNELRSSLELSGADPSKKIHINLEDDNLLVKKSYFSELLLMIKEIFPHAGFSIDNGLDYTNMTIEFLDFLIKTGFNSFTLSLGSSDRDTLKEEKRPANLRKFEQILKHLHTKKIPVCTFLICGLPEDTVDTITNSLIYLHNLPTDIGISLFYPVPGIPHFENKRLFLDNSPSLCRGSSAYPWTDSLGTKEMVTAFRLARFSNLIKKRQKNSRELDLIDRILSTSKLLTFGGKENKLIAVPGMNQKMIDQFIVAVLN